MSWNRVHAAVWVGLTGVSSASAHTPVYGGPTYNPSTSVGYSLYNVTRSWVPLTQAGDGVGFGNAYYYDGATNNRGLRPIAWGPGYAAELSIPGTSGTSANALRSGWTGGMNANGLIVGSASGRPVRWTAAGVQELDLVPVLGRGTMSATANAVNAAGTTVGNAGQSDGAATLGSRAVRWDANGTTATVLGLLSSGAGGFGNANATGINDAGTVIGTSSDVSSSRYAEYPVRWNAGSTTPTRLLTPVIASSTSLYAINGRGDIIGGYTPAQGTRAVRWSAGATVGVTLESLNGQPFGGMTMFAASVNNNGVAVGEVDKLDQNGVNRGRRAVRWDADSPAAVELAGFGTDADGNTQTAAAAINDSGLIVGAANVYVGNVYRTRVATVWDTDGVATDLNTLIDPASGWTLDSAINISNTNWVSGTGAFDPDGAGPLAAYTRAFLIQIPEPTAVAWLSLVAVGTGRRRRGGISHAACAARRSRRSS